MSFTEVKSVTYSKTTKDATCDITVEYSGSEIVMSGSSVSCSIPWPTKKDLDKNIAINVIVGDVLGEILPVKVSFNLFKKKNQDANKTKTKSATFTVLSTQLDEAASYPSDLWCPAEDKIIFGDNGAAGVANETVEADWQGCAEQCATYLNSNGNAPCFSWTFNSGDVQMFGLEPGVCRLLSHMNVRRLAAQGVQSGYHKCWRAYSTSQQP